MPFPLTGESRLSGSNRGEKEKNKHSQRTTPLPTYLNYRTMGWLPVYRFYGIRHSFRFPHIHYVSVQPRERITRKTK